MLKMTPWHLWKLLNLCLCRIKATKNKVKGIRKRKHGLQLAVLEFLLEDIKPARQKQPRSLAIQKKHADDLDTTQRLIGR